MSSTEKSNDFDIGRLVEAVSQLASRVIELERSVKTDVRELHDLLRSLNDSFVSRREHEALADRLQTTEDRIKIIENKGIEASETKGRYSIIERIVIAAVAAVAALAGSAVTEFFKH